MLRSLQTDLAVSTYGMNSVVCTLQQLLVRMYWGELTVTVDAAE